MGAGEGRFAKGGGGCSGVLYYIYGTGMGTRLIVMSMKPMYGSKKCGQLVRRITWQIVSSRRQVRGRSVAVRMLMNNISGD
jgi:hypothetical protein